MLLIIALALALPVIFTGVIFRHRGTVTFAALLMAGVGVATGNPVFIGVDLVAVGIAYAIGLQLCRKEERK